MTVTARMLETHPGAAEGLDPRILGACIDACTECATACTSCADACLAESRVGELVECVRLDLECADLCAATGRLLTRGYGRRREWYSELLSACVRACEECARECESHASHHEHCRVCAEACRRCAQACRELMALL
ncbi:four-helix bundle copper-binding protein [Nocardiopsis kunsanensis]|uniref:Four-helix bundle copper-binding protein n=1 Tax=Nocardiopsis kunsanensis TaxID=141693 RepID=A0A919CEY7_9ACTN|nr:four-helix bundle copper-binding protein [Nocardiopsis kunsanensis]GHD15966.1 hypothetical protein GCM10007147_03940 [Nocardiopsis kunsanensis]